MTTRCRRMTMADIKARQLRLREECMTRVLQVLLTRIPGGSDTANSYLLRHGKVSAQGKMTGSGNRRRRSSVYHDMQNHENEELIPKRFITGRWRRAKKEQAFNTGNTSAVVRHRKGAKSLKRHREHAEVVDSKRPSASVSRTDKSSLSQSVGRDLYRINNGSMNKKQKKSRETVQVPPEIKARFVNCDFCSRIFWWEWKPNESNGIEISGGLRRKSYQCRDCRRFVSIKNSPNSNNNGTSKRFICETCNKTFDNTLKIRKHIMKEHPGVSFPVEYEIDSYDELGPRKYFEELPLHFDETLFEEELIEISLLTTEEKGMECRLNLDDEDQHEPAEDPLAISEFSAQDGRCAATLHSGLCQFCQDVTKLWDNDEPSDAGVTLSPTPSPLKLPVPEAIVEPTANPLADVPSKVPYETEPVPTGHEHDPCHFCVDVIESWGERSTSCLPTTSTPRTSADSVDTKQCEARVAPHAEPEPASSAPLSVSNEPPSPEHSFGNAGSGDDQISEDLDEDTKPVLTEFDEDNLNNEFDETIRPSSAVSKKLNVSENPLPVLNACEKSGNQSSSTEANKIESGKQPTQQIPLCGLPGEKPRPRSSILKCRLNKCRFRTWFVSVLIAHRTEVHGTSVVLTRDFHCPKCLFRGRTAEALENHKIVHDISESAEDRELENLSRKSETQRTSSVVKMTCRLRGCSFRGFKDEVVAHRLKVHGRHNIQFFPFRCEKPHCNLRFRYKESYDTHVLTHQVTETNEEGPDPNEPVPDNEDETVESEFDLHCRLSGCSFQTKNKKVMRIHRLQVHGLTKVSTFFEFRCKEPNCNYRAKYKDSYDSHMVTHQTGTVGSTEVAVNGTEKSAMQEHVSSSPMTTHRVTSRTGISYPNEPVPEHEDGTAKTQDFYCRLEGCFFSAKTVTVMRAHRLQVHGQSIFPTLDDFRCKEPSSNFKANDKDSYDFHMIKHQIGNTETVGGTESPAGGTENTDLIRQKQIEESHLIINQVTESSVDVPNTIGGTESAVKATAQTFLSRPNRRRTRYPCTQPGCKWATSSRGHLHAHLRAFHLIGTGVPPGSVSDSSVIMSTTPMELDGKTILVGDSVGGIRYKKPRFPGTCNLYRCKVKVNSHSDLAKHREEVHGSSYVGSVKNWCQGILNKKWYYCSIESCNVRARMPESISAHIRKVHDELPPVKEFSCPHCGKRFTQNHTRRTHIRVQHGNEAQYPKSPCMHCTKTFSCRSSLLGHLQRDHPDVTTFRCTFCQKIYYTEQAQLRHEYRHAKWASIPGKQYKCTVMRCTEICESLEILRTHVKNYHDIPYDAKTICEVCGKETPTHFYSGHLQGHQYRCDICDKTMWKPILVDKHKEADHPEVFEGQEKTFSCDACGVSFYLEGTLKEHQLVVHEERKLRIPRWGKGSGKRRTPVGNGRRRRKRSKKDEDQRSEGLEEEDDNCADA